MQAPMCKDCMTGALHTGTPRGTVTTLHGLPTYVTQPPSGTSTAEPTGVVILISDAFGWELPNSRILADQYAEKGGFTVYLPDFMDGHWLAHDMLSSVETALDSKSPITSRLPSGLRTIGAFLPFVYYNRASVAGPRIYAFVRAVRASTPLPLFAAGFCWGGKWTALLCAPTLPAFLPASASAAGAAGPAEQPLLAAGFTAHPSGLSLPDDVARTTRPLSIANGTRDFQLTPAKMEQVQRIFADGGEAKRACELRVYDGMAHGFAVRGDPRDEAVRKAGVEAEDQAVAFFKRHAGASRL